LRKKGVPQERTNQIIRLLRQRGSITVDDICTHVSVSPITARRDLGELEELGFLRRIPGGAISVESLLYEPFLHDSTFVEQLERNMPEKRRIALAAADLVGDGMTLACTAGTTTTEVIRCLRHRADLKLTLVTNAVNIAMEAGRQKNIDVFLTGGHMRGEWFALAGADAVQALRQHFVNMAFIGVNGMHIDHGLTCFNEEEAVLNAAMVEQAEKRIVVADHSKLSVVASRRICSMKAIDMLITDDGASEHVVSPFASLGIEVRRV
jgi:DeoR family transcriptional regulator, aga operon transcriptional repressor